MPWFNKHLDLTNQFLASLSSIRTDPPTVRVEPGSRRCLVPNMATKTTRSTSEARKDGIPMVVKVTFYLKRWIKPL